MSRAIKEKFGPAFYTALVKAVNENDVSLARVVLKQYEERINGPKQPRPIQQWDNQEPDYR